MLTRLHHVAIIASDYEQSKDFYTRILGFTILAEHYREERQSWKCDLKLNDTYLLELFTFPDSPSRPTRPEALGLRHIAFQVEDLDGIITHLSENQIVCEPVRMDEFTGARFTFFSDPDGLPIELVEKSNKHMQSSSVILS